MIENIIKRDGSTAPYNRDKIVVALTKAYLEIRPGETGEAMRALVSVVVDGVENALTRAESRTHVHVEDVQDQIELQLMRKSVEDKLFGDWAKAYMLYRAKHAEIRAEQTPVVPKKGKKILVDGVEKVFDIDHETTLVADELLDLKEVNARLIVERADKELYEGATGKEATNALILAARTLMEVEPEYNKATARLEIRAMYREVFGQTIHLDNRTVNLRSRFPQMIRTIVDYGLADPVLTTFDLHKLAKALDATRDAQFDYIGIKTLYTNYFINDVKNDRRLELPQTFFMRVAMGLAINEQETRGKTREDWAIEFYNTLSTFDFMNSTPTLFNAGLNNAQLASCFLTTIADSIEGIGLDGYVQNMLLQKFAGGLGNDYSYVRALGSFIKGTNGKSQGIVPWLNVTNALAVAVNQGGKRKGAVCAYLETWHLDIEDFLDLRKNTGDDRRRTHDMNTANWVPDLFMKRVMEDSHWTLFSPNEVPELHDLVGIAFEKQYAEYEAKAARGEMFQHKTLKAKDLWRRMLSMLFETGHPWITFKDACNLRSPQQHVGVVHSSNLCVAPETMLLTDQGHFPIASLVDKTINVWNGEEFSETIVRKTGENQDLLTVQLSDGRSLDCTPYHKWYVQDTYGASAREVRTHELEPGMKLIKFEAPVLEGKSSFNKPYTNGFFTGDGTQLPNGQARIYLYGPKGYLDVPMTEEAGGFLPWRKGANDRMEVEIWGLSEKFTVPTAEHLRKDRLEWLAGWLDADGTVQRNGDNESIVGASVNFPFLQRVQFMLQTLGVNAKITQMHRGGARMMPLNDGSGAKAEFDVQPLYRLLINSVDSQKLLQLGLYCRRLKIAHREPQRAAAQFVAVMDVVNTYRRDDTYCVTEPKRHMAVFNGILTGNCTEITLNTKPSTVEDPDSGETAVCNIGSINLANHILPDGQINTVKLARTVGIAMRMLDNVIDLTMYTVPKARRSNQTHRPVGLGMMGFQDCLFKLRIPYASQEAVAFADKSMELISFHAISASVELSKERGAYASFKGSLWDQGILPVDSQRLLSAERGDVYIETNFETFLGEAAWADLRKQIQTYGMRNSNCMAIAPTATIGNIVGVEASIEPCFANVSVKSNLSGEFTVVNEYLVKDFKQLGIWDEALLADLKYYGGSVQQIARVPDELKRLYQTAFEVGAFWLIDAAARRQKWIDQAQSLNIYIGSKPTGKMLDETYKHAWLKGLKTTYYLRALQATNAESSTGRIGALNAVPSAPASPPMGLASPQKVVEPTSVFIPQLQAVAMPEPEGAACMYRPGDPEFASCDVCQ